jgi:hypothetical protein
MKALRKLLRFFVELARELSDENAYARYLQSSGRPHSTREWQSFTNRHHRRKYQNAKCC